MRGLAFLGVGKVGIIEKPIPEPGPNDAVIQTTASSPTESVMAGFARYTSARRATMRHSGLTNPSTRARPSMKIRGLTAIPHSRLHSALM
jgi:hypothetical protein